MNFRFKIGGRNMKSCPYCGSDEGYYMHERVHRCLFFDFNDESIGASDDVGDYSGKRKYCLNCNKILPKKLFKAN